MPDPQAILKADSEGRYFEALDLSPDASIEQVRSQEVVLAHRHRDMPEVGAAIHHSAEFATAVRRYADGAADARLPDGVELCWFCKKRPAVPSAVVHIDLYKIVEKSDWVVSKHFLYKSSKTAVPRCSACRTAHDIAGRRHTRVGWLVGLALAVGLTIVGAAAHAFVAGVVCALGFGTFFGFLARRVAQVVVRPGHSRPLGHSERFPAVKEMRDQGWLLGTGPSRAD